MILIDTYTKRGKKVTLNQERWNHLVQKHPEMSQYLESMKEVLSNPDIIVKSNIDENVFLYHKYYKESGIFLVVAVQEEKGFIVTAYTTDVPKRGYIVWSIK